MIKVVIVEDEELIRQGMKLTMEWEKFDCRVIGEAADGEEGMEIIERLKPDIVFTDIRMPKMSGLAMVEQIKDSTNAKFIILSGYDEFNYAKKAINLGASGYLLKPIDDDEFEEVLKNTVEKIKAEKQNVVVENPVDTVNLLQEGFKDKYISQACQVMRKRLHEELTLKMVADELHISESYLGKLFKNKTSYTFLDVLTLYRIRAAIDYLEETNMKVYEISYKVGYNDSKYFSKTFQKLVGIKPKEYREGYHLSSGNILNQLKSLE